MNLTPKQEAFCDYYIETGNAAEAARRAGYSKRTANAIGAENLTKPAIKAYIAARMNELSAQRQATANEVIEFYTAAMRGEVRDQFGLDPSLADRLKAADSLMKRFAAAGPMLEQQAEDDALTAALKEEAKKLEEERENADQ